MKLILTADVDHLGSAGDTVEVKDGYGRNFLLPRGLAIVASRGAQQQVDDIRRARESNGKGTAATAGQAVKTAGDSGKLFGSVTAGAVVTAIRKAGGPNLDKRVVRLPKGHIKAVGSHPITLHVHPDVDVHVALDVVAES